MKVRLLLLISLIILVACGSSESPASDSVPTPEQRTPVGPTSTEVAPPAAGVVYGRNDDGTFFHGAADAPVTFIDYSDFL